MGILSALLFMSTLVITGISYYYSAEAVRREIFERSADVMTITGKNLEDYLGEVSDFLLTPLVDTEWTEAMYQEKGYFEQIVIENKLKNMALSRNDIAELSYYNARTHETFRLDAGHKRVSITEEPQNAYSEAFQNAASSESYEWLEPIAPAPVLRAEESGGRMLRCHRVYINIRTKEPVGMLTAELNGSYWRDAVLYAVSPNGEDAALFAETGALVCAGSERAAALDAEQSLKERLVLDGEAYTVQRQAVSAKGLYLVKLIPERHISEQLVPLKTTVFGWCLFLLLLAVLPVYAAVRRLTLPLRRLAAHIEQTDGTALKPFPGKEGGDEVGLLTQRFNEMTAKINRLVNSEYKARISEQEARLEALEAQLNPHFLSNALQAVSTTILQGEPGKANRMLAALGRLINVSFRGPSVVPAEEELRYVNDYFMLIRGRFDGRFEAEIETDGAYRRCMIPKFAIQCLAENVVKHVLEKSTGQVRLRIRVGRRERRLEIEVSDNGGGMGQKALEELAVRPKERLPRRAVGLANLRARLEIVYGERAGLEIFSGASGTTVKITIDGVKEEEYVESADAGR